MDKYLFIRADGNSEIGLGHIMRTMTIANVFRENGYNCLFLSSCPISKEVFARYNYKVIELEYDYREKTEKEANYIIELVKNYGEGLILVDSYYAGNDYLSLLKGAMPLICINSTKNKLCTDFLINENIACDKKYLTDLYSNSGTKLLLGQDYSLVRKEFTEQEYSLKKEVGRILITTGGGDQYNFMTTFLQRIKDKGKYRTIEFLFISGACNANYYELEKEAEGVENVQIIQDAADMGLLMNDSDLAISAGGTTILELAVVGVPSIGIAVANDQVAGLSYMGQNGMIEYAGRILEEGFWDELFLKIDLLINDYEKRLKNSVESKRQIDGKGAYRIFIEITSQLIEECKTE